MSDDTISQPEVPKCGPGTKQFSRAVEGLHPSQQVQLDQAVADVAEGAKRWVGVTPVERVELLRQIKDNLMEVAQDWVEASCRHKQLPPGSSLAGEEWLIGPYAVMSACDGLCGTLSKLDGKSFLHTLPLRQLPNGQTAVQVFPNSIRDKVLLSGVSAEIWMKPNVSPETLSDTVATAYANAPGHREPKTALVLGAGNVASITPLDCFYKLFTENQTVVLKMNPVNDYLAPYFELALKPLMDLGALRIVTGGAEVGEYLCAHPGIDEIHITGAGHTHDAIVWGAGEGGINNKSANTPKNRRRITSELGAVCPTIVVPGPWSRADLRFQAEHVATQKLHNSGFNCIACQMLIMSQEWAEFEPFLDELRSVFNAAPSRPAYYPGAAERMAKFERDAGSVTKAERLGHAGCLLVEVTNANREALSKEEVFAPAMGLVSLHEPDPGQFLEEAISYANQHLGGTLAANILIHPKTLSQIGRQRFEEIISGLQYGAIAVNAWGGLNFLLPQCSWGAFPGHTIEDVQSGIGHVHNSFMFESAERSVVYAPFKPFPRSLLSGNWSLLPRPPWFITNKLQHRIGELLTRFQHRPSWSKIPRILWNAVRG